LTISQEQLEEWKKQFPEFRDVVDLHPTVWINTNQKKTNDVTDMPVSREDVYEAETLWERFAPYFKKVFPETRKTNGMLESPLKEIGNMKQKLSTLHDKELPGNLYLKCDNDLSIVGSIKARGGIYEILSFAEYLAIKEGLITTEDNYEKFTKKPFKDLFGKYTIGVGSTGNLGLSVGVISANLGFNVSVYMSVDASPWKKSLLRKNGVVVNEFPGDFGKAIRIGREETNSNPFGYFVDDEDSKDLFLGYSAAVFHLQEQLSAQNITVDKNHPLFVYLPCGVGGAPGGITFGLKQFFGDNVHCFFAEPTHSPSTLVGLLTGKQEHISVQDIGVDNITEGDGMAVGRPSKFATQINNQYISGVFTEEDDTLYHLLAMLADEEDIYLEPSATIGMAGPWKTKIENYARKNNLNWEQATHISWSTGGSLVPEEDMQSFYRKGASVSL